MTAPSEFEIFLVAPPGMEPALAAEARMRGFKGAHAIAGGVAFNGGWPDVWRANLEMRGAARVMARIAGFRALHLAQLDKRSHAVAWADVMRRDVPFRVEASCRKSKIYHSGAAAQRVERAIIDALGAPVSDDAALTVKVRIEDDFCTISLDTTGEPLHKRGHKLAVNKAPMRENLAYLFLAQCGYRGGETVVDPMCGSGTFVIEAAEIAAGLRPGRTRRFAFEQLATFDAVSWQALKANYQPVATALRFYGSDRDAGAVQRAQENAERAGVAGLTAFGQFEVGQIAPPPGAPGLVIVNPPYGARIGERAQLGPVYRALGSVLKSRFAGWRVGLITTDAALVAATGLPFGPPSPPVAHGGLRVMLFQTGPLGAEARSTKAKPPSSTEG